MTAHDDPPPRSARPKRPPVPGTVSEMDGRPLLLLDVAATVVFLVVTVVAAIGDSDAIALTNLVVTGLLFVGTCILFVVGFLLAAARSRDDDLHLSGLFYLTAVAPESVRRTFMGLWFAQILIGVAAIPLTAPPFGVMATMFGVFVNMVWSARHGSFRPHPTEAPRVRRSAPE